MIKSIKQYALRLVLAGALLAGLLSVSRAQDDGGPDFYRVVGVSAGSALNLRAGPTVADRIIARIPSGANGLRNLGCQGGLSFAQWSNATQEAREAARRTRWCRVEYQGAQGWAAGWYLAEGGPPESALRPDNLSTTTGI